MALALRLEEVAYSYPLPGKDEAPALSGVTLEVDPGTVLCIAGANGSGKSTLAQLCAGLLRPTSGTVLYGGAPVRGRSAVRGFRRSVGILFQSPEDHLFADTVSRDVAFGPRNHGLRGDELERRVREAAAPVGLPLETLGDRSPFSLSGGEKRRVALAGVFALEPEVLVLDEPFIGLDFDGREHLKAALRGYRERHGASVLIVTHDLTDAWGLADRFALLAEGRLERTAGARELSGHGGGIENLGMRLPQWGDLAREMARLGIHADDPTDATSVAAALAAGMGRRGG